MSEGETDRSKKLLLWVGVGVLFLFHVMWWDFMVDDAFISFRYARNLLDGLGLVYNPGEHVEGYSNPLWVLITAVGAGIGITPPVFSRVLGLILGAATLGVVANLTRRLDPEASGLTAAALLAATGPWAFWVGAGLDAPLFAFGVVLAVSLYLRVTRESGAPSIAGLFAVCALAALTRPEGLAAGFVVAAALVFERRVPVLRVALGSLAFFVPVGGHLAWRWNYYGELLPNTYYAKIGGSIPQMVLRGLGYLRDGLMNEAMLLLVAIAFAGLLFTRSRGRLIVLGGAVGYALFILWAGGDGLYKHRFIGHIAPLLAVAAALALRDFGFTPAKRRVATAVIVGSLLMPLTADRFHLGMPIEQFKNSEERWTDLGLALREHAPADLVLATNVAGRLPYYAGLRTLDLLGLCDAHIARSPAPESAGYAGHERADAAYVLDRAPDLIYFSVLDGGPHERIQIRALVAQRLSMGPLRGYAPLISDATFAQKYRPAAIQMGERHANIFVLRTVDPAQWNGTLHLFDWVGE